MLTLYPRRTGVGGIWFASLNEKRSDEAIFGTTLISEKRLRGELGNVAYLDQPPSQMQHVYALKV